MLVALAFHDAPPLGETQVPRDERDGILLSMLFGTKVSEEPGMGEAMAYRHSSPEPARSNDRVGHPVGRRGSSTLAVTSRWSWA